MNLNMMTEDISDIKNISFRLATQQDATPLCELAKQTFYEAFGSFNTDEDMNLYSSHTFSSYQFEKQISEKQSWFLLVYDTDSLIGYARLRRNSHEPFRNKQALEIERFYICASHTGRHIGSLLMQECLNHATLHNTEIVWLGVWEHNLRALAFYTKWGFSQFGSHPFLLGKDVQTDLLMKREL